MAVGAGGAPGLRVGGEPEPRWAAALVDRLPLWGSARLDARRPAALQGGPPEARGRRWWPRTRASRGSVWVWIPPCSSNSLGGLGKMTSPCWASAASSVKWAQEEPPPPPGDVTETKGRTVCQRGARPCATALPGLTPRDSENLPVEGKAETAAVKQRRGGHRDAVRNPSAPRERVPVIVPCQVHLRVPKFCQVCRPGTS